MPSIQDSNISRLQTRWLFKLVSCNLGLKPYCFGISNRTRVHSLVHFEINRMISDQIAPPKNQSVTESIILIPIRRQIFAIKDVK